MLLLLLLVATDFRQTTLSFFSTCCHVDILLFLKRGVTMNYKTSEQGKWWPYHKYPAKITAPDMTPEIIVLFI